jgi:hypothetical protein
MISEVINCGAMTREGRCARCAVCRVVQAIENINVDVNVEPNRRINTRLEAIADNIGELVDKIEYVGDAL